ncbi:SF3A3 domain [Trypanosoma melophagium]|uniref:SF3A3 domain n=1 Tax=Trypanosoma melophagium TaxID=715481 RepID=UPI00351A5916|nr:SF3A3 domain [Trypanosoma melophagium]
MFGGVLEKIRLFEADIEHHIDNIVQQKLLTDITNKRHLILRDHFIMQQAESIGPIADKLLDLYLDQDEIVEAQEAPSEGDDVLSTAMKEFEAKVADIREYHRTFRDLPPVKSEIDHPDPSMLEGLFSVYERYGSCLDLESHYHHYSDFMLVTSKRAEEANDPLGNGWKGRVEYFSFIPTIPNIILNDIDPFRKVYGFTLYRKFVEDLINYLIDFYGRIKVMEKDVLLSSLEKSETDAEEYWSKLLEHKKAVVRNNSNSGGASGITSTEKSTATLITPAPLRKYTKTFALWPITYVESMTVKDGETPPSLTDIKAVIQAEGKIVMLLQTLLFETLQETEKVLLRDYSKTAEEIEWERKHLQDEFIHSVEEARKKCGTTVESSVAQAAQYDVMTTLAKDETTGEAKGTTTTTTTAEEETNTQLLDRDGKPVARWLVQLQQLHKRYCCEVCGDTVYIGPKAFREHFGAERHAEGLRRLGVTHHLRDYEGISSIRMVIAMRDKVMGGTTGFRKRLHEDQEEEEMQDAQGNVITAGAYRRFQISRKGI